MISNWLAAIFCIALVVFWQMICISFVLNKDATKFDKLVFSLLGAAYVVALYLVATGRV